LHPSLGGLALLGSSDPDRTIDPRPGRALDELIGFLTPAALQAHQIAVLASLDERDVITGHHPAVADEHHTLQAKTALEILDHRNNRLIVVQIAAKHVVGDGPPIDHDQPDLYLTVTRLAVAAVPVAGKLGRSLPFEIGGGQVVEDHLDFEREEVPQPREELLLDELLVFEEIVQGAIPVLQPAQVHPHTPLLLPLR